MQAFESKETFLIQFSAVLVASEDHLVLRLILDQIIFSLLLAWRPRLGPTAMS